MASTGKSTIGAVRNDTDTSAGLLRGARRRPHASARAGRNSPRLSAPPEPVRRPSTCEHGAEPDAWGRQAARSPKGEHGEGPTRTSRTPATIRTRSRQNALVAKNAQGYQSPLDDPETYRH